MKFPVRAPAFLVALVLCLFAGGALLAASPPGVQWVADVTPDASQNYAVDSVHRLSDGTVLVLSILFFGGITASHLDGAGAVLSTRELPIPDVYGRPTLLVDPLGAVFVGMTTVPEPLQSWVMKFDGLTGRALWPGPFHYRPEPRTNTLFRSLALDLRGDVFVTGASYSQDFIIPTPFLFKLDGATGRVLWGPVSHADPSTPGLSFTRVNADANGDAVVSGNWSDGTLGQITAFKFDGRTGAPLWGPVMAPADGAGQAFPMFSEMDPRGDLVVAGQRSGNQLPIVVKFSGEDGSILWGPNVVDGTTSFFGAVKLVRLDAQGDILLWASAPDAGSGIDVPTLRKISGQDGSVVWGSIPYPGDANAFTLPVAALIEPNGDVVATYSERRSDPVTYAASTVRFDGKSGTVLWGPVVLLNAGGGGGLLLDPAGNVLLASSTHDPSVWIGKSEIVFYAGATGEVIRGPLDLPPTARMAYAVRVAADSNGDVVTLGRLLRGASTRTVLVKYRGATGSAVWGPIETSDDVWGVDMKLAQNGDPIWVGTTQAGTVLLRLSASTGASIWGVVSDSGEGAMALELDGTGDVFVLSSLAIRKYEGRTGRLLWTSTSVVANYTMALAVGPTGDVTVAAWSSTGVALAQYRGSTGSLAWGPVSVTALLAPQGIGIDPRGDILLAGLNVVKLRGTDGSISWGPVAPVVQPSNSGTALALDKDGNPVVATATFDNATQRRAAVVVKYDNASGVPLWGPVTWDATDAPTPFDFPLLAVDSSGDVVLAARGMNDAYLDMAVRKYSGSDGSPIWGPVTLDGPGTSYLASLALAGKDVVLAGSAAGSTVRTVRFGSALSLETQAWQVPPALCGQPYSFAFQTRNGAAPLAFAITGGALPAGLFLDPATGVLSGAAGPAGTYSFRLRVGSGVTGVERDFTIVVVQGQPVIDIAATASTLCAGGSAVLSVAGAFSSFVWLPGGETTPTLTVSPSSTTTYDFVGTTAGGCIQRGSRTVTVLPAPAMPSISAPSAVPALASNLLASVADHVGSQYRWSIAGGAIVSGQGTHQIQFTAGVGGDLTLTVVEATGTGCLAPPATFTTQVTPVSTQFFPVTPCRIYDSRSAGVPFAGGEVRRLSLAGLCSLSTAARAVAMNVTAVGVSGGGSLSVAPAGSGGAAAGGPSWQNEQVRAASTIVGIDATGAVDVSCHAASGAAHLVIDVAGYFE